MKVFDLLFPVNMTRYNDISVVVYSDDGHPLYVFPTTDDKWRLQTFVDDVDTLYVKTLLAREDQYFWYHPGINPLAILRACWQRLMSGRTISGGSTLTMQTVRLLEPRPRTLPSKLIECLRALQLEYHHSKVEILNMYLTLAPCGSNIEGLVAASRCYFAKPPLSLTPAEIALLVALPQSPTPLSADLKSMKTLLARQRILSFMVSHNLLSITDAKLAYEDRLPVRRQGLPKELPHLAWRLRQQYPYEKRLDTTINLGLQRAAEHALKHYEKFIPPRANCGFLIMDHRHNDIIVYVGSRNFFDSQRDGQVDFTRAIRSPGSTLKPFIYAMGFSLGIVQPDSLVLDDQQRFGNYKPGNFDKNIHGVVTIQEALTLSLNIPVVNLLNQIGPIRFLGTLREIGIYPKFSGDQEAPSLAIALGGLGMKLEQLMVLYGGLARNGNIMPLRYLQSSSPQPLSFYTPQVAQQITAILKNSESDDWEPLVKRGVAFKTGTSYGHRDTWALGYDERYVIGVWIGIPDGSPMGAVSGRSLAVPLLRRLLAILPASVNSSRSHPQTQEFATLRLKNLQNESVMQQQLLRHEKPSLMFPINNMVMNFRDDNHKVNEIPLTVKGGQKPYVWFVDDQPLAVNVWKQKHLWQPPRPGFYKISVMDAGGTTIQAYFEIR